jgi:hypothetical protein
MTIVNFPNISVGQYSDQEAAYNYRNFFGRGENKYAVYPPSWNEQWYGRAPMLGMVFADDEFLAEKAAYDRGLVPGSMPPVVKLLGPVRRTTENA